jgi:DNA gyrase inhibitor GyrI
MERDFKRLMQWMEEEKLKPSAPPISIYHDWNLGKGLCDYTLGFPLDSIPGTLPSDFLSGSLPETAAFVVEHTGPYHHLGNAWSLGMTHVRNKTFRRKKKLDPFETYLNNPNETPAEDLITRIFFPRT